MISRNADYSIQRLRGLSTDTKPTDTPNGSEFREMDTGKDFMYDAASGAWKEQPTSGASGGGGGGVFVVTKSNGALDKTYAEIDAAYEANQIVMLKSLYNDTPFASYLISFVHDDIAGKYVVTFSHTGGDYDDMYAADTENGTLTPYSGE